MKRPLKKLSFFLGLLLTPIAQCSDTVDSTDNHESDKPHVVGWHAFEHVCVRGFDQAMDSRPYNLVAFIHPKDFESEKLEWEWPFLTNKEPNLLSVNCSAESELCREHDVRTYPTVRMYRAGKMFARYRGPRKADEILAFARRSLRPVVSGLDASNLTSFSTSDSVTLTLHLRDEDASKGLYKRYHDLANEFHDRFTFGIVSRDDDNSVDEEGENAPSVLRCRNNRDGIERSMDNFFDRSQDLRNFVEACGARLIRDMSSLNMDAYLESQRPVLYYFDADPAVRASFTEDMRAVAKAHREMIDLVIVDPLSFSEVVDWVGLPWQFPAMALQNPAARTISLYNHENISEDVVGRFIVDTLGLRPPLDDDALDEGIVLEDEVAAERQTGPAGKEDKVRDEL